MTIDLYKYSKKNKFFKFIITKIFKVEVDVLIKPVFLTFNIDLQFNRSFFYNYKIQFPETKWMKMKNAYKFYQSNHDLDKHKEMKLLKKILKCYLTIKSN